MLALDINARFLRAVKCRHGSRLTGLELIAADLETAPNTPALFDLIHAALLFEHADPALVLPTLAR